MNINTTYFEAMLEVEKDYIARRDAHDKSKPAYDSPEFKKWKEIRKLSFGKYPIPMGVQKAYRAYQDSVEKEYVEVVMTEFLWDTEVEDFINALKKSEIESFIYTNSSSAVMDNIHAFVANGCEMGGLVTLTEKSWP